MSFFFFFKIIARAGIFIALGVLFSQIEIFKMQQGGSVNLCSSLFFVLPGYFFGFKIGLIAGVIGGLTDFFLNPFVLHPRQFLLDYIFAFVFLGIGGSLFYKSQKKYFSLTASYLIAMFFKFICHFLSGIIFFASYAPENMNACLYAFIYNFSYIWPEIVLSICCINLPVAKNTIENVYLRENKKGIKVTKRYNEQKPR